MKSKKFFAPRVKFAYLTRDDVATIEAWVHLSAKNDALKRIDKILDSELPSIVKLDSDQQLIVRMAEEIHFLQEKLRG